MRDVRHAVRSLLRQPGFSIVAVATVAIAVGANVAIFSLLYQTLLKPLPYGKADRLVYIWNTYPRMGLPKASVSIPDYLDRKTQAASLEDAALMSDVRLSLVASGEPVQLRGMAVTPSFFSTLDRRPSLGRPFADDEAEPGNNHVAILTASLWKARFAGDPSVIGREVKLGGEPYTVVGVLPADFLLPSPEIDLLVPFAFTPAQQTDAARGNEFSMMIGRLRPAATIDQLNSDMRAIVQRNLERLPERRAGAEATGFGGYAVPMREEFAGDTRAPMLILQASVFLLMAIACVNVANLLLMRATGRMRELAIRASLGAGRAQLLRLMLIEGMVIAAAGGLLGVLIGVGGLRAIVASAPAGLPVSVRPTVDAAVVGFALLLVALTGAFFGALPSVVILRERLGAVLNDESARSSGSARIGAARNALVVAETALALILLVGAGLLVKSLNRLHGVNTGFRPEGVLTAQINLPAVRYADPAARATFWARLLDATATLPGVTSAGLTSNVPFNGNVSSGTYRIVGYTPPPGEALPHGRQEVVGGDYFRAMQIPLLRGRLFDSSDVREGRAVAIVDQLLVDRYFPNRDPIGQQIQRGGPTSPPITIVGVVGTINAIDLSEPVLKERIYYPVQQAAQAAMGVVLKTPGDPALLTAPLRRAVQAIDPEQPMANVRTMTDWVERSLEGRRTPTLLLVMFGTVAMILAAMGLYGVLAYGVEQRRRELGIRQALGANRRSILTMVLRQGLRTTAIGLAVGLVAAAVLSRYLAGLLFEVDAIDPIVFVAVPVALLAVAAAACYVPARRATRVDPAIALRA
ncbi:MAG TPA: ABC transporter permease [Vicinamibacterales bacterium]|nr:ABC transporter permease [Vicinamibacterales bacterium]